jgi:hypothetical protein
MYQQLVGVVCVSWLSADVITDVKFPLHFGALEVFSWATTEINTRVYMFQGALYFCRYFSSCFDSLILIPDQTEDW